MEPFASLLLARLCNQAANPEQVQDSLQGRAVTQEELTQLGWELVGDFGRYMKIFNKGRRSLLWYAPDKKIISEYDS